jgi:hypothetical protein
MTSALTGIGEDKEYVLMSESLHDSVVVDEGSASVRTQQLQIDGRLLGFTISSLERDESGSLILCIPTASYRDHLIRALIEGSSIKTFLLGDEFKSSALRIESDTCYLRLTR